MKQIKTVEYVVLLFVMTIRKAPLYSSDPIISLNVSSSGGSMLWPVTCVDCNCYAVMIR